MLVRGTCPVGGTVGSMILFGNSIFTGVIKVKWCQPGLEWAVNPVLMRRFGVRKQAHTERAEDHAETGAELGA